MSDFSLKAQVLVPKLSFPPSKLPKEASFLNHSATELKVSSSTTLPICISLGSQTPSLRQVTFRKQ